MVRSLISFLTRQNNVDLKEIARYQLEHHQGSQRVCAITTYKGRVTAIGLNSYVKTHPEQARLAKRVGHAGKQYLHAEVSALLKAKKVDAIHVFRLGKDGKWRNARPCAICELAIKERYVTEVTHT